MATQDLKVGDLVTFIYKSGEYIGHIYELRGSKAVIEVKAVLRHPKQGDLHRRGQADVEMFHQRRALSYREKSLVPSPFIKKYSGEVPDYETSLRHALQEEMAQLRKQADAYAEKALASLLELEQEYFSSGQ